MGFSYGAHIDLRTGDPWQDDPATARSWGRKRIVAAKRIMDLLVGRRLSDAEIWDDLEKGTGTSPSVFLSGARITGQLDLRGIDFEPPLLQQCALDEPLLIEDSMSRSIRLYGCHLPGVSGAWLKCSGDLHLRDCRIAGMVDLTGAYVAGQLVLSGSTLSNPGGVAVRGDGLVVTGDLFCRDGATVEGEVSLVAARIEGELRLTRSTLRNPGQVALRADRITVEKDLYCRDGFTAEGEVRLLNAQVKGQVNFNDATLRNPQQVALHADHLVVGSHLYCQDRFTAHGEIRLVAACIGGEVRFSAATLSNPGGTALRADRLVVADDMYCRQELGVHGALSLQGAHIEGQLNFNHATLHNPGGVALDADHLVLGSHLYCQDRFTAHGKVSLVAARVGGEVRFSGSALSNRAGEALRADRLYVAADMYCRAGLEVDGMVSLRGAHIGGQLNFNHATLRNVGRVALDADQLVVGSHLYCQDRFTAEGEVRMVAARVGGEVRFSTSTLTNPGRDALCADRLVVGDDMYCREGLVIDGAVSLEGAHVNGDLNFSTTTILSPDRTAMRADQLTVGNDLCCDEDFTVEGMIDLTDVHVGGELNFSNATVENPGRVAIFAPRLIVDKDMFCRERFTADGTVCLIGAHIGGKLSFTSARLTGAHLTDKQLRATGIEEMLMTTPQPSTSDEQQADTGVAGTPTATQQPDAPSAKKAKWWRPRKRETGKETDTKRPEEKTVSGVSGLALVADGLRVETDMTCDGHFASRGEIRLKGARVKQNLDFSDATVDNRAGLAINAEDVQAERMLMPAHCPAGRITLRNGTMVELDDKRGVEPDQIDITGLAYERLIPPLDVGTRLEWLARNDYEPQPYDQLARSYRQLGYDDEARQVQLAQERRQRDKLRPIRKIWGYVQDQTIGYGYLPYRAAALFALVLLAGVVGFWIFPPPRLEDAQHAYFNPFFYTLDVFIPFADFGQRGLWGSTMGHEIAKVVLAICGWILASTAIAGLTRTLTRS